MSHLQVEFESATFPLASSLTHGGALIVLKGLDHFPSGNVVYCPVRGVIAACEGFSAIVQRPVATLMGARMDDLTHPDDATINGRLLEQALVTRQPFVLQKRYIVGGGAPIWVESRYTVLCSSDDSPLVSMSCRRIEDRTPEVKLNVSDSAVAEYLSDMAFEMARLARASNLLEAGSLLSLAALSAARVAALN